MNDDSEKIQHQGVKRRSVDVIDQTAFEATLKAHGVSFQSAIESDEQRREKMQSQLPSDQSDPTQKTKY